MQLFYTPDIIDSIYTLDEQESKHCVRVLRMQTGDVLHLIDGKGTLFKAEITKAQIKACTLKVVETFINYQKRNYYLHLAIAPTKNIDRFEWFLEKSTEIGIDEITPLICEHSERKVIKTDRLERVIVSAMKQSVKAYKPILNPIISFSDFIRKEYNNQTCFIAHCNKGQKENFKHIYKEGQNACVLIGPEGDFTPEEVGIATVKGFNAISLGESRLRTETAGVVACHTVNLINQ
jgi:16S rRNA (uracil1498-N3)-methyltransferase